MGELIRNAIAATLDRSRKKDSDVDPLFSDQECFTGPVPADISAHHDKYLYGKADDLS